MNLLSIFIERSGVIDSDAFTAKCLEEVAPRLASEPGLRAVALYLPDSEARATRHRDLPASNAFDGLLEIDAIDVEAARALVRRTNEALTHARITAAYLVRERRLKTYPRTWPDRVRSPGAHLIARIRRARTLDAHAFDDHWRDRHGPLALRHHTGMWDYRQCTVIEALTPLAPPIDGIAHLGFPTRTSFDSGFFDSPEGWAIIARDTRRFVDMTAWEIAVLGQYIWRSGREVSATRGPDR